MSAKVRPATVKDLPTLLDLMEQFYAESAFPLDRGWAAESFTELLRNPAYGAIWLLLDDGVPAGHLVLTIKFSMEYGGLEAFIDDLYVRPGHRRRGLASCGIEAAVAECVQRGVIALHVEVGSDNAAAQALYSGHGLRPRMDRRELLTTPIERTRAGA